MPEANLEFVQLRGGLPSVPYEPLSLLALGGRAITPLNQGGAEHGGSNK